MAIGQTLGKIIKQQWTINDYIWLLVNLLPLVFYAMGQLNAAQAFLLYVAETIIIGAIVMLKMGTTIVVNHFSAKPKSPTDIGLKGLALLPFFVLHYGIFVFAQFGIFMSASGLGKGFNPWPNLTIAWQILGTEGQLFLYINAAILLLYAAVDFFARQEYKHRTPLEMMFDPYARIFVQQFTVILGGVFLDVGAGAGFLIVFMIAKIFFTCFFDPGSHFTKETQANAVIPSFNKAGTSLRNSSAVAHLRTAFFIVEHLYAFFQ
jgi:Family of unknown function (DUF6498)